ncbi:MAG: tetratricopeptide repeat protein [Candidatus Sericytochromatia bacterium]|nr:tetratricopeptide repeat protein [Candidatus Tanganyikabacteria bacterium]
MTCPACGTKVADGARFCSNCGSKLERKCSACQTDLADGQRFCGNCGQPVDKAAAAPAPKPPPPQGGRDLSADRRVVTVLFTDVSGFTAMSEKLDPEEVTEIVNNFFKVLTEPIYRFGGVVDKYIGDAIMALFGAPVAHEDDPERAVRAAWDMQVAAKKHADELFERTGIMLKVRIGLNTGLVVAGAVGGSQRADYTVVGDTVNLAQRMEANARPGKVLVTAETFALTREAFNFVALDPVQVKGKAEPVAVYELAGLKARTARMHEVEEMAVLGRDAELGKLAACLGAALDGNPQFVAVVGEVGLGKSALARQFIRSAKASGAAVLWGRGVSYEQQTGYSVVATLIHYWLGLPERSPTQDVLYAVGRLVGEHAPDDDGRTAALVGHLLSVPVDHEEVRSLSPKQQRSAAFLALNDLLLARARQDPLVISLEDVHWADEASLEWLISLADRVHIEAGGARLLVLCQTRPGSAFSTLALGDRVDLTEITLRPLARDAALGIAATLLGATSEGLAAPVAGLLDQVLARAEGNPFYLAELLRSLMDGGVLVREGAGWTVDRPAGEFRLPTTVQGAIAARLDKLRPDLRKVIQLAAVVGRSFEPALLERVVGAEVLPGLGELTAQGFLYGRSTGEVAFSQVMTQEVAYQNLLLATRREYHKQVGDAVEEASAADRNSAARTLAFHFARAEVADKACRYLLLAGNQALAGFALAEALASFNQALEWLAKAGGAVPEVDPAEIKAGLASVQVMTGDLAAALENLEAALAAEPDGPLAAECHRQVIKALIRKGDSRAALSRVEEVLGHEADATLRATLLTTRAEIEQGQGLLDEASADCHAALALLEGTDCKREMAGVYNVLGNGAYLRRSPEAISHYQKNLALREAIKDVPGMATALNNLALAQAAAGQWSVAAEAYGRALKIYQRIGDVSMVANIQNNLGDLLLAMGRIPEAEKAFNTAQELYVRLGNPLGQAASANFLGKLAIAAGQGSAATLHLSRSFELLETLGARAYAAEVLRNLGHAHLLAGDLAAAREVLDQALQTAEAAQNEEEAAIIRTLLAELHSLAGLPPHEATSELAAAIAKLRRVGNPLETGRALLRAARIFRAAGDLDAASQLSAEAAQTFENLGAALDLAAARALVAV